MFLLTRKCLCLLFLKASILLARRKCPDRGVLFGGFLIHKNHQKTSLGGCWEVTVFWVILPQLLLGLALSFLFLGEGFLACEKHDVSMVHTRLPAEIVSQKLVSAARGLLNVLENAPKVLPPCLKHLIFLSPSLELLQAPRCHLHPSPRPPWLLQLPSHEPATEC